MRFIQSRLVLRFAEVNRHAYQPSRAHISVSEGNLMGCIGMHIRKEHRAWTSTVKISHPSARNCTRRLAEDPRHGHGAGVMTRAQLQEVENAVSTRMGTPPRAW